MKRPLPFFVLALLVVVMPVAAQVIIPCPPPPPCDIGPCPLPPECVPTVPGVFTENLQFHSPEEIEYSYKLDGRKSLCNVGSVGQPRDGDWRACYILLDQLPNGANIQYRRVEYDVEKTIQKIYAIDDLENFLGDRLREGR